ncbi:putative selenium-dependent hydroxylase accessory protein YqeC [Gottschalkia purinilytica]|uniref:Putative selenium-dependent hydroxylase accessory protein YqeC n=1 Tax=Gottschalkia purinilytica TaxID=1503 RepID=A0A0L0W753_GOTPU|nr:selenium cofactor biosynthesis protein YqeC [Gottschalkia purinilytica]KNF07100.1 putative selenium-dependent hydroxylase accessory protein YqeC [Gottschalkia purinilytica]
MNLSKKIDINLNEFELVSIVGGGGKTTTMFKLAKELRALNKKVLVTTTTAIMMPDESQYDNFIIYGEGIKDNMENVTNGSVTVIVKNIIREDKLKGIEKETIEDIVSKNIFDVILVEADGSKRKPIKAPSYHEPVIPNSTTKVIGVIGMDSVGKEINEKNVHRPEIFTSVTDSKFGEIIDENIIFNLVISNEGLYKDSPKLSKKYLILNKAEGEERISSALKIKNLLLDNECEIDEIIVGSMNE